MARRIGCAPSDKYRKANLLPQIELMNEYADEHRAVVKRLDEWSVADFLQALAAISSGTGRLFLLGNGGSATTAEHLAIDLSKGVTVGGGSGLRAVPLVSNSGALTAWANDESFESVFARQLEILAGTGDAVLAVSASGRSPNVVRGLQTAKAMGLCTLGLLGMDGGEAAALCDHSVIVRSSDYGLIEDVHLFLGHLATRVLAEE